MVFRLLFLLLKSALMVALFKLLSPVAQAVGLQFQFVDSVASSISHFTAMPYYEAEVVFLFLLATTILEAGRLIWDITVG
jgi:hypothetical protein